MTTESHTAHPLIRAERFGREHVVLLGIVVIAVAARLYGIARESLWLDEATSLMLARMDLPELVEWTSSDVHPPLYYALLHYWIALGESEAALRSLSVLAGTLNVLVIYSIGRTLFPTARTPSGVGIYAALLLAVNPFHIWYSQETRMYAWIALLSSSSLLCALLWLRKSRTILWLGYVLITAAGLYTHYYAVFVILVENIFFLYLFLRGRLSRRTVIGWGVAQICIILLFAPWLPNLLNIVGGGGGWLAFSEGKPPPAVLAQTAISYMVGTSRAAYPKVLRRLGYLFFSYALLQAVWSGLSPAKPREGDTGTWWSHREAVGVCGAYVAVPLLLAWGASQLFKPMYSARYMLPFLVPFLLLVAIGVQSLRRAVTRGALLGALLLIMGVGVIVQAQSKEKPDWRGLAARVVAEAKEGDIAVFMPVWHAGPFDYYAQGAVEIVRDVPMPVDRFEEEALGVVDRALVDHDRIWFIWETGHYTDPSGALDTHLRAKFLPIAEEELPLLGSVTLFGIPSPTGDS